MRFVQKNRNCLFLVGTSLIALSGAPAANAQTSTEVPAGTQTSPGVPPEAQSGDNPSGLGDIVVTAQRREQRLQDVPIAVTALTNDNLRASGVQNTVQLAEVVPGLSFTQTAGFTQVRIRGIGTSSFGPGIENPVATYVDGVYIASAAGLLFDLASVKRVEVLKGPQGTLFGRNATGGLVQVITAEPSQDFSGGGSLSYGNYQTGVLDLYATGGVTDNLAADFSIHFAGQGKGYGKNVFTGDDVNRQDQSLAVRSKIKFVPTSNAKFILTGDYSYSKGSMGGSIQQKAGLENIGTFEKIFTNRNDANPANDLPIVDHSGFYDVNYSHDPLSVTRSYGVSLDASIDIGSVNLQSITAYRSMWHSLLFDLDSVPQDVLYFNGVYTFSQLSQEFKVSGKTRRLNYAAGLFYFHSSDKYDPSRVVYGPQGTFLINGTFDRIEQLIYSNPKADSYAAYAQGTYALGPATNITLGGRYTREKRSNDGTTQTTGFVGDVAVPLVPAGTPLYAAGFDKNVSYGNFSYRIALDQKITRDIMVYASYNTGFKSGGYNASVAGNPAFQPEKLNAYEVGLKSESLDHKVRLNISGFLYDYTNMQINNYTGTSLFITNGPKARIKGIEAEIRTNPLPGLTLSGSVAYTDDAFTKYPLADYNYLVPGCIFTNPSSSRVCQADAKGNKLPGTATFTGNIGMEYERKVGAASFGFSGNLFHSSGYFGTTDNDPRARQGKYDVLSASLYFQPSEGGPRFSLWGRNLLNERYASAYLINAGAVKFVADQPRTYGVRLEQKF